MTYTVHRQFEPSLDTKRCTQCGTCLHYCPVNVQKLKATSLETSSLPDPLRAGLEGASCFVAHDPDSMQRRSSASGGVATAILSRLLATGKIDAVIHAERINGTVGSPHFSICISRSVEECENRRSSLYGPLCYEQALQVFRGTFAHLALTGVPCVISGLARLFKEHPEFRNIQPILIGLVCGHNVSGQFVDYLAQAMGVSKRQPFVADLRDKTGIPDADNFNTCFRFGTQILVSGNRFKTPFTSLWRSYCFALEACHYCSDFWAKAAHASIKDAWGRWAQDPLGKSIIAVRNPEIRSLLEEHHFLETEPLPLEEATTCQKETSIYKLTTVSSRFNQRWFSKDNRKSGFTLNFAFARISRNLYHRLGFNLSKPLLTTLLLLRRQQHQQRLTPPKNFSDRLRNQLLQKLPRSTRQIVLFGAGTMGRDLLKALPDHISYLIDNDASKYGAVIEGKRVLAPESLVKYLERPFILIGVAQDGVIAAQLNGYGFQEGKDFLRCRPCHVTALKTPSLFKPPKRSRKILVLGGYGYGNTGDEAQLNANIQDLGRVFPNHLIKVLSPNPVYTHLQHGRCAVGDAPRTSFYDAGETSLYNLRSRWEKVIFLLRSGWLYINSYLVRMGLSPVFLKAKRSALLHDLATADLVFFSGGGYLTGSTLSRLWDGLFFMAFARILRVPVVLSGQTIGVWNSRFTQWLAAWGLQKAELITTRDADDSMRALTGLGLHQDRYFSTCDDALFCSKEQNTETIAKVLLRSGISFDSPYLALNIHYWGLPTNKERSSLLEQVKRICEWIQDFSGLKLLGIPMIQTDLEPLADLANLAPSIDLKQLDYDFDFRKVRAIIAGAQVCVTMKHHPIIFAMGEDTPAISLASGAYYHHKNLGALNLFGMSFCNIGLEQEDYFDCFKEAYRRIQEEREYIIKQIRSSRASLENRRNRFMKLVSAIPQERLPCS
ncbi:MAG: polysaccharide pyruvyl transferase family protein [Desulforhabdus sp.]|nr:polysaccharide pyruvyl transferase family protein [Desulforhabdus sp.]